jgi:hypothetical protein
VNAAERLQVGVCILRIEAQPDHLIITVTTNRNLDRNLFSARPEPMQRFSDPDEVIEAVAQFLRFFG